MDDILNLLYENMQWLFSGIGVTAIIYILDIFKSNNKMNINIYQNNDTGTISNEEISKSNFLKRIVFLFPLLLIFIYVLNPSEKLHIKNISELESFIYLENKRKSYKNYILYSELSLNNNKHEVITIGFLGIIFETRFLKEYEIYINIRKYVSEVKIQRVMVGYDYLNGIMKKFYNFTSGLNYENKELVVVISKTLEEIAFILHIAEVMNDKKNKDNYFSYKSSNERVYLMKKQLEIQDIDFKRYTDLWERTIHQQIEKIFINEESYFSDKHK